jgi:5-methylcytosine-specific restriction endonuclease McrA
MKPWPAPSAEQQLVFLQHLQRLFDEGDFTSTYKYALLLALAELAVELGDDGGAPLCLPMSRIAEKFAEFYWPQTTPFSTGLHGSTSGVLSQNVGQQAAVIRHLSALRAAGAVTLVRARQHPKWPGTVRAIAGVVRNMPVRYLQNLSGATVVFLYDPVMEDGHLRLLPGVASNMRRFQGFIQQLVRAGWVDHVRGNTRNASLIGQAADLESFMFGSARADLSGVAKILRPLQNQRCFFCQEPLHDTTAVDHFIPWSRYPRDTALNFVLAHAACNHDKRELLASRRHLDHWLNRNRQEEETIAGELQLLGFIVERDVTKMVGRWAYQQAVAAGAQVWLARGKTEPISADYMAAFA